MDDRKNSDMTGAVLFLATLGIVVGTIGVVSSLIPLIGAFAFFVSVPATIVSGIAYFISRSNEARRTLAIIACAISSVGVILSFLHFFAIATVVKHQEEKVGQLLKSSQSYDSDSSSEEDGFSVKIIDPKEEKRDESQ